VKVGTGTRFGAVTPWLCRRCYCRSNYIFTCPSALNHTYIAEALIFGIYLFSLRGLVWKIWRRSRRV